MNAAGQLKEKDCRDLATQPDIHVTMPRFVNCPAIPTKTANQVNVSHADFSLKQSSQSRTPNNKSIDKPIIAATTLGIPIASPVTQSDTASSIVPTMVHSFLVTGPILSSFLAAIAGASGVSLISGGYSLYNISGVARRETMAGKLAALNQETQGLLMITPSASASLRQRRF